MPQPKNTRRTLVNQRYQEAKKLPTDEKLKEWYGDYYPMVKIPRGIPEEFPINDLRDDVVEPSVNNLLNADLLKVPPLAVALQRPLSLGDMQRSGMITGTLKLTAVRPLAAKKLVTTDSNQTHVICLGLIVGSFNERFNLNLNAPRDVAKRRRLVIFTGEASTANIALRPTLYKGVQTFVAEEMDLTKCLNKVDTYIESLIVKAAEGLGCKVQEGAERGSRAVQVKSGSKRKVDL